MAMSDSKMSKLVAMHDTSGTSGQCRVDRVIGRVIERVQWLPGRARVHR